MRLTGRIASRRESSAGAVVVTVTRSLAACQQRPSMSEADEAEGDVDRQAVAVGAALDDAGEGELLGSAIDGGVAARAASVVAGRDLGRRSARRGTAARLLCRALPSRWRKLGGLRFDRARQLGHRDRRRRRRCVDAASSPPPPPQPASATASARTMPGRGPPAAAGSFRSRSPPGRPGWPSRRRRPWCARRWPGPVSASEPSSPIVAVAATDWPTFSFACRSSAGTAKRRSCSALADVVGGDQQLARVGADGRRRRPRSRCR